MEFGPLNPVMGMPIGVNVPLPMPRKMVTVLSSLFATARSSVPSLLKSPATTVNGCVPTAMGGCTVKVAGAGSTRTVPIILESCTVQKYGNTPGVLKGRLNVCPPPVTNSPEFQNGVVWQTAPMQVPEVVEWNMLLSPQTQLMVSPSAMVDWLLQTPTLSTKLKPLLQALSPTVTVWVAPWHRLRDTTRKTRENILNRMTRGIAFMPWLSLLIILLIIRGTGTVSMHS